MKTLALILIVPFMFSFCFNFQDLHVDVVVDGEKDVTTLTRKKTHLITIEGSGFEEYSLSGRRVALRKSDKGYYVTPDSNSNSATITVTVIQRGKKIVAGTILFKISD